MKCLWFILILSNCSIVVINAGARESGGYGLCETTNNEKGICIPLLECNSIRKIFEKTYLTPDEKNYLESNKCGYISNSVLICCPIVNDPETGHSKPTKYPDYGGMTTENRTGFETNISTNGSLCFTTDSLKGSCIPFHQCPFMVDIIKRTPLSDRDRFYLRSNHCGRINCNALDGGKCLFNPRNVQICCPTSNTKIEASKPGINRPALLPSPGECGVSFAVGTRIIGGNRTGINEYPWIAALVYTDDEIYCSGFLINHLHVVTAAHCVMGASSDMPGLSHVRLGDWDLEYSVDCDGDVCSDPPIQSDIDSIVIHGAYTSTSTDFHDIALLKLSSPITYTKWIRPLCLPVNRYPSTVNTLETIGWGTKNDGYASRFLQKVELPFITSAECSKMYKKLQPTQMCAGGLGVDSCSGDSGGPLMSIATHPDTGIIYHYAIGIVSFGATECGKGEPGVYTKTDPYMDWILRNIA